MLRLSGDRDAAEELAHEAFVKAYRGLGGFRGDAQFGTWVIQIALHLARDRIRQQQRRTIVSLEELKEQHENASALVETRPSFDPVQALDDKELKDRFETALQELPPSYREVFVLHHLEDVPYEEIAQATGDSVGSLKVRAHRARKLLKESLFPDDPDAGRRRWPQTGR
jgi:RNA polymerase sigma-70 factor (ECF subfamily)